MINWPLLAVNSMPARMISMLPVVSMVIVDPLPSVMFWISCCISRSLLAVLITWVAPRDFANCSLSDNRSIPIMILQHFNLAVLNTESACSLPVRIYMYTYHDRNQSHTAKACNNKYILLTGLSNVVNCPSTSLKATAKWRK